MKLTCVSFLLCSLTLSSAAIAEIDPSINMDLELQEATEASSRNKNFEVINIDESIPFFTKLIYSKEIKENCKDGPEITLEEREICKPFNADQKAHIKRARELLKLIVKSSIFKKSIENYKWETIQKIKVIENGVEIEKEEKISGNTFVDNKGLSNNEIYQRILAGAETRPEVTKADKTMNLELLLYNRANRVVGYTNGKVKWVKINEHNFSSKEINVARNLMHEWLHKLGFGHEYTATPTRPFSVPYGVGTIMLKSYVKLKEQGLLGGY